VVLGFMPDRFHNERVAEYRGFAGRDGALNRIRLPMYSDALAAVPWVARTEPMP
jgi:hypothetical protein